MIHNERKEKVKLKTIYEVEPELEEVYRAAVSHKREGHISRLRAYGRAKQEAEKLLGLSARNYQLRSREAWDCFFDHVLKELNL